MKLIVCSKKDLASKNIKEALLTMEEFDRKKAGEYEFFILATVS